MDFRSLTRNDVDAFRRLREEALELEPLAFTESLAEHRAKSREFIAERLGSGQEENFVMGAFSGEELAAMAGFYRLSEEKARHKGCIWGVYVSSQFRRKGIGQSLMLAVLNRARAQSGLEQITLAVSDQRPAPRALYLSLGFKSYAIEPRALKVSGVYVDEEWMALDINI